MSISFNQVPSNLLVPIVSAEFDNSKAAQGPALLNYRACLIGQKLAGAPAAANSLVMISSADQAATLFGRGSMLHRMAKAWFADNQFTELRCGVLLDDSSAAIAIGTFTVSGPATAAGTLYLYVGGKRVTVAVNSGDSASTIAAAIATAIGQHAAGTVTFASAAAADTFTIGTFVFVGVAGAVTPGQLTFDTVGGDPAAAASAAAQIKAHAGASALVHAEVSSAVLTVRAIAGGTGGNAIALASSSVSHLAVSGATLLGATADTDLPVHASVAAGVVTVHAMNAGAVANETDLRLNYNDGESLPAGVAVAVGAMAGGSVNPTLTSLVTGMGDIWLNVIANPYTDATSIGVLETELASRAGPTRMIDGVMLMSKNDTLTNVTTLVESRNSQYGVIVGAQSSPTPPEEIAADLAAVVALSAANDPARPLQTLALSAVLPPAELDRYKLAQRNTLLNNGGATIRVGAGNVVQIERLVTTYRFNAAGSPDTSYQSVESVFTLMYLRYSFAVRIASRYPRHKLADDGTRFGAGQAIITPSIGKAEAVTWFLEMEELGLVEDVDQFKTDLVVERNVSNTSRLDFLLPPNLINQLVTVGAKFQFRL